MLLIVTAVIVQQLCCCIQSKPDLIWPMPLCCRDDDMQSIASMMTPDTSYDIGNMADIDNDDYNDDDDDDQGISIVNSDSNLTITELTSHIQDTFTTRHSSAHGIHSAEGALNVECHE